MKDSMAAVSRLPSISLLVVVAVLGGVGVALAAGSVWTESFARFPADWASPRQSAAEIRAVFQVARDGDGPFLRAAHDAVPRSEGKPPPAVHFGRAFRSPELKLASACILRFEWRVLQHPRRLPDPWTDLGASVYVVTRSPGLIGNGRGFKFGWLSGGSATGQGGTNQTQRGILQLELRRGPTTSAFVAERVDLCALYEKHFGPVGDEKLLYVGVVTDADDSKSVARADYADFSLGPD